MARVSLQEYKDYQKKNRDPLDDLGVFGQVVKGIVKPFVDVGRGAYELGNASLAHSSGQQRLAPRLTPEELANPGRFAMQTAAGLASYAIPGVGGGVIKLATQGLGSGLLQGYANQDVSKDVNAGEIVKSGLVGAGIGTGLGVAGKVFESLGPKLRGAGKTISKGADTAIAKSRGINLNSKGVGAVDDVLTAQSKIESQLGGKPFNETNLTGLYNDNFLSAKTVAQSMPEVATATEFVDYLRNGLKKAGVNPNQGDEVISEILGRATKGATVGKSLNKLPNIQLNGEQVMEAVAEALNKSRSAYTTINAGATLSDPNKILKVLGDSTSEFAKSKIPTLAEAFDTMSAVNKVYDGVAQKAYNGSTVNILGNQVNDLGIPGAVGNTASKVARGVGGALEKTSGKSIPGLNASNLTRAMVISSGPLSRLPKPVQEDVQSIVQETGEVPDYAEALLDNGKSGQAEKASIINAAINQGWKITEAIAYANAVVPTQPKLSAADRKILQETLQARSNLARLKQLVSENESYFNPISGQPIFSTIGQLTGDSTRAKLQTSIAAIMQNMAKGLEGGKLTDKDRDYYLKEVAPSLSDSPDRVYARIEQLEGLVADKEDAARQLIGQQGLNINLSQ